MFKKFCFVLAIAAIISVKCFAVTDNSQLLEQYLEGAPDNFEFSQENSSDYSGINEKIDFNGVFKSIFGAVKSSLNNCIGLFVSVSVVVLLFSMLDSFEFNTARSVRDITASILSIAILSICLAFIKGNIEIIKESVETMKVFTTAAMPVIGTLCITSGESFSAAMFSGAISLSSSVFEYVTQNVLLPLIILYLCFGVTGNISERYNISSANDYIKRFVKWTIGIFVGVFTASLSLQSFLSHSSDTLVKRGIKTAVGSFIPFVGGTLSAGVDSMFILASNSKTSFAVLGIVIIAFIFMPHIIGNLCYGFAMTAAKALASFLKVPKAEKMLGVVADTFFILSAICSACVYMVIVSFLLICINIS